MSPQPPASRASLERQLRALRRQLAESEQQRLESEQRRAEAEETLEAIRTGQVDALVVGGPAGDQVYTLEGADRSYRLLVETVNAGAATLGPDGVILYANRQLARMLGVSLETLMGTPLDRFVAPDDLPIFRRLVEEAQTAASAGELRFLTDAEQGLPVQVALRLLDTPELRAVCLIATDLTERKHAEESLRQAKARLSDVDGEALKRARAIAGEADEYVRANPWQVIGTAAGIALLLVLLMSRR